MVRNQNNRNRGKGKSGKGNFYKNKSSSGTSTNDKKKTLEDYKYDIGSSKNASECVSTTKFLIQRIATTFVEADDIATALSEGKHFDLEAHRPSLETSKVTGNDAAEVAKREKETREFELIYSKKSEAFVERQSQYRQNKPKAAALIIGHCTERLKTKLHQRSDWDKIEKDPVLLLAAIKEHAMNYEATQYRMKTLADALKNWVNLKQNQDESLTEYLKRSKAAMEVFYSHAGLQYCFPKALHQDDKMKKIELEIEHAIPAASTDQYKAAQDKLKKLKKK